MTFLEQICARAKAAKKTIAVPEADNPVMMQAACSIQADGVADILFVGDPQKIRAVAAESGLDITGIPIADNTDAAFCEALADRFTALPDCMLGRKSVLRRFASPLYMALALEAAGDCDITFAGLDATTGEVVMAATAMIGLKEGVQTASCFFACEFDEFQGQKDVFLGMSDGGVCVEPTAEQLAGIAIASCDTYRALKDEEARCAMLSFSTDGSGAGPQVDKVRAARDLAKQIRPDLLIDGEFQSDAALVPRVAAKKVRRDSDVAGRANVLIFPDIASCNIGSKLVQLTANCRTYGPLLQGFRLPVCDCSRSDTSERIYTNMAFSVVLAQK